MSYILIIAFYASTFSSSDSVSLTTAHFQTMAACINAGKEFKSEAGTLKKNVTFICAHL